MKSDFFRLLKFYPVLIALGFCAFYISATNAKDTIIKDVLVTDRSSITFVEGTYRVDSTVIRNDINKKRLLGAAETAKLISKNTFQEVPEFIRAFLDSVSYGKKFDIVNPGEDWKSGITNYGHLVYTKLYDVVKKDTVLVLSGDGAVLPNKQLCYFGISNNMALMSYFRGGFGTLQNVIILSFTNDTITDFWYGAVFEGSVATKKDIIKNLKAAKRNKGC